MQDQKTEREVISFKFFSPLLIIKTSLFVLLDNNVQKITVCHTNSRVRLRGRKSIKVNRSQRSSSYKNERMTYSPKRFVFKVKSGNVGVSQVF